MCGLAGIINKNPRKFDFSTFCTLGISNDIRGGDSCGIFIDGIYQYGVDKDKYFQDFFINNDLLYNIEESQIALVHCRKASVGLVNEKTAQPVIITNKEGEVEYVLMHNGTIYNYKELAEKYIPNIDIKGMTDSQVMAHIFYHKGYNALNEYNGGAVFIIVDYRGESPRTLLFKGASKRTEFSKEIEEERPLYYCIDPDKGELVFSSIGVYLLSLRNHLDTYIMEDNVLAEFDGKHLLIISKYTRENCTQTKKIEAYTYYISSYVTVNTVNNIYSFKGKVVHGKVYLSNYGSISSKQSSGFHEVWYFKGILLKNKLCYDFINKIYKESKLSLNQFTELFENLIRFLSVDGIYKKDGIWRKAISATQYETFSGVLSPATTGTRINIENGKFKGTSYGTCIPLNTLPDKSHINFNSIYKECMSLMN